MKAQTQTELGSFIKKFRKDRSLSQAEVEAALEIEGKGYISKLESGEIQAPREETLGKLAEYVGKTVEELRAMCRTAVQAGTSRLRMACGHSLWNAPICAAAGDGLLSSIQVSSFYRAEAGKAIPSEKLRAGNLAWITSFSDSPVGTGEQENLVPLSAADVASLLQRGEVEIGALPGNLVRDGGVLQERCICVGTVVDTPSGCSLVYPQAKYESHFPAGKPLSTWELGNQLSKLLEKRKRKAEKFRIAAQVGTVAAEYLDRACEGRPDVNRGDVIWDIPAAELRVAGFHQLSTRCQAEEKAELVGVIGWEPHVTWLLNQTSASGLDLELGQARLHFAPRDSTEKQLHLTYEVVIPRRRLSDPSPVRRDLFQALNQLMTAAAETAVVLNKGRAGELLMRRLAEFYGLLDPATTTSEDDPALAQTRRVIGGVLYSVRWNVVPELGIGPQA